MADAPAYAQRRGSVAAVARHIMNSNVTYSDGVTPVTLGDQLSMRVLLHRRVGRVIYVPGISPERENFAHHGLTWVGVAFTDGMVAGSLVRPETGSLDPGVRFVARGHHDAAAATVLLDAADREQAPRSDEDVEEAAQQAPTAGVAKPTVRDWLAGAVAVCLYLAVLSASLTAFLLALRYAFRLIKSAF